MPTAAYIPTHQLRIVTAASLFDGHDAAINIMRRIMQASGAEVIHLGHNRSAQEIVNCAIQEDAQAIAITSYQGGHIEFFKYIYDLLRERDCAHIKVFGGGGGTILPQEIAELHQYGIARVYSPDDGRAMGLQGMINDLLRQADFSVGQSLNGEAEQLSAHHHHAIARLISAAENYPDLFRQQLDLLPLIPTTRPIPIVGITGTGGSGKSSMVDELVRRFLLDFPDKTVGIISVDPSKRKTGGALLGDRIRMNAINHPNVYMRSLATRQANLALSRHVKDALHILKSAQFDLILLETSGIGQSDTEITEHSDLSLYIMTPEYGAASQLEKIDMLDFADLIALNKFDKRGALDALRDVKKQYKRNHHLWDTPDEQLPVFGTIASQFNDTGTNELYKALVSTINHRTDAHFESRLDLPLGNSEKIYIIPPKRTRYLAEIAESNRRYDDWVRKQADVAQKLDAVQQVMELLSSPAKKGQEAALSGKANELIHTEEGKSIAQLYQTLLKDLDPHNLSRLENWTTFAQNYRNDEYIYLVRNKEIRVKTYTESLSRLKIPKISLPRYTAWGDLLRWLLQENVPGEFPYTAGVFPFKRENEDPTRMFAGEGNPERTNKRFHYVSLGMPAKRLSTAFDSVTLYGEDPDYRPDIYGKIGNSGVSICCLDDAKKLYSGFDLCQPNVSVSMTINGPAAAMTAFFLNAAIDQQCELFIQQNGMEDEVRAKIAQIYAAKGQTQPRYNSAPELSHLERDQQEKDAALPEGNNGLGLLLLGITGDQVLPADSYQKIKAATLSKVRGTVQADILKEDQAQNTCIFSTEFSLRLMGDMQQYFI
ncbi:MAG: methylmalonyl-CoA mutase family protein, partial [Chitinophagales bacterium]|nr:methylmalonyl-CoA mutase family protein [Chitinophagales bacterium]